MIVTSEEIISTLMQATRQGDCKEEILEIRDAYEELSIKVLALQSKINFDPDEMWDVDLPILLRKQAC